MTTTRALLDEGAERLRSAGVETPRLDAELLLAHAIGVDRTAVIAHGDAPVGAGAEANFRAFLDRRVGGEPVAYLRGFKEFHGIALGVDDRALIPRPETELLVDLALLEVMRRLTGVARTVEPVRVIDVGTGSGAIVVALAVGLRRKQVPPDDVALWGIDCSVDALALARENAVGHGVGDRVAFELSDLLPPWSTVRPWDVVVANLPYIRTADLAELSRDVGFEPSLALDGGEDGLAVIARLLGSLETGLARAGVAYLEIGADHESAIADVTDRILPGWVCEVVRDLAGLPRVAIIRRAEDLERP